MCFEHGTFEDTISHPPNKPAPVAAGNLSLYCGRCRSRMINGCCSFTSLFVASLSKACQKYRLPDPDCVAGCEYAGRCDNDGQASDYCPAPNSKHRRRA